MIGFISRIFYRLVGGTAQVPVTLGLRNIYILPTGYGLLYLTGLAAMLIGSINYNNNLGFLLTFLLGSLGLTAMLYTYAALYGLRMTMASTRPVFAGESMDVEISVADVERPRIALQWFFDSRLPVAINILPERDITQVRIPILTRERGWFAPPRLCIACDYPLGLFRAWARIHTGAREVVYPQPVSGPVPAHTAHQVDHDAKGAVQVMGADDFLGLNAYQPGDPPQRIHWQAYSRGRGLHVKQFTGRANGGILLDLLRVKGKDVEKKLSILTYHVLEACRLQRCVGLRLGEQVIPPETGMAHRNRCLRALALFQRQ